MEITNFFAHSQLVDARKGFRLLRKSADTHWEICHDGYKPWKVMENQFGP
jgi:hypothetical protein